MLEVQRKTRKLKSFGEKDLKEYLEARPVPVVICPNGEAYIIDHHHLVRACWEAGVSKMLTELKANLSHFKKEQFWTEMQKLGWTHLFDQFGNGPHLPDLLPYTIQGVADDFYRSLAWAVREQGGFEKSTAPFCEFKWADFFRKKLPIDRSEAGFKAAVAHALKLCQGPEAKHLPGYIGP